MTQIECPVTTTTRSRALFLDRDGVINVDHGYVHIIKNFEFIDGIFNLARTAYTNGFKIVVITNQSGIGRGLYSEQQFDQLTSWMCKEFMIRGVPLASLRIQQMTPEPINCVHR